MIGDKPTCAVCEKGKYGCRCADTVKSYIYSDDQARDAIKVIRKDFTMKLTAPGSYPDAIQKLMLYVAERLPKKMKTVHQISIDGCGVGTVAIDEAITRTRDALRMGMGVSIGRGYEVPDDQ